MRLYMRSADRRPDPPPLQTNDRAVILAGTVVWAVLFVVAALMHARLAEQGRSWWIWTPLVGVALGLYGLRYLSRRTPRR